MHCTRCRKPFSAFTNFTNCWRKFEMATWVRLFKADGCPTQEQRWIYMACSDQAQQHPKKQHRNPWFQQWSYIISVFLLFFKGDFIIVKIFFPALLFYRFFAAAQFVRGATSRAANFTLEDFNDFCCSFTAKRDATIMIGKLNLPGVQVQNCPGQASKTTFHWNPMGKTKSNKIQEAETHNESQTPPSNDSNSKLWMV